MRFSKLHEGAGDHRGVAFEFTILETDGIAFSEINYTLPSGPTVSVAGSVPYPTMERAVSAVKKLAATAIDAWLNKKR
jgi:hypothetical protein